MRQKFLCTTILAVLMMLFSSATSFAQAQDDTPLPDTTVQEQIQDDLMMDETHPGDNSEEQLIAETKAPKKKPRLHYTDGRPARWERALDISVQGGSNGTSQLLVVPTNIGLSTSVSIGFHGEFMGFTAQYETGRLYDLGTLSNEPSYTIDEEGNKVEVGEKWTFFEKITDDFHAVSLTLDFYATFETMIFRFGVGAAVFFPTPLKKDDIAGGLRLETSWQWPISKHLRAGFELEVTTILVWTYWRPSMVVTIVI